MNVLLILFSDILPHRSSKTVLKESKSNRSGFRQLFRDETPRQNYAYISVISCKWRYEIASRSQAITTMEMKNTQECVVLMRGVGRLPKSSDPQMSRK